MIWMLECLKLSQRLLSLSSFVLNSCFFILSWLDVYLFQIIDLSPSFLPFTVGSLYIFLYFTLHISLLPLFCDHSQPLLWASWLSILDFASERLAISSSLSSVFGALICCFIWAIFLFVLAHLLHCKGQSLRYSPGRGNPLCCVVVLYVGEVSEREQCQLLGSLLAFSHFPCYTQANWALLVLIPGWVGLCTF